MIASRSGILFKAGAVFYLKQGWYLCTICKGAAECVMGNSKKSGCAARTAEPQFCGILANLREGAVSAVF